MTKQKCTAVPGCHNDAFKLGACQKHYPAIKRLADEVATRPPPLSTKGKTVLSARLTERARLKLNRVAKRTSLRSAYRVASEALERMTEDEILKVLSEFAAVAK